MIRYISTADRIIPLSISRMEGSAKEILDIMVPELSSTTRLALCESMLRREQLKPTVMSHRVAFPRAECEGIRKIVCGVGISEEGVRFGNGEVPPAHTLFVTLYPKRRFKEFVVLLQHLVRFSHEPQKMALLRRVPSDKKAFEVIQSEVLPWGMRDWLYSRLILPAHDMLTRMEAAVKVRHG